VLERHHYGADPKACVAFDVHSFRTTSIEHAFAHVTNSRKTFQRLLEKVRTFDESQAGRLIAERDYQALDQMVLDHLLA